MTRGLTVTKQIHFRQGRGSRKVLKEGKAPKTEPLGNVPRISRLMALTIHMQELVDKGKVADYADLARLAHVSRARITQIMNLLLLAPDIQEEVLFLPPTAKGKDPVTVRQLRPVLREVTFERQRQLWRHAFDSACFYR